MIDMLWYGDWAAIDLEASIYINSPAKILEYLLSDLSYNRPPTFYI